MRNSTLAIAAVLALIGATPAAAAAPVGHGRPAVVGLMHTGKRPLRIMHPRMERPPHAPGAHA